jgi:hypothetical protein
MMPFFRDTDILVLPESGTITSDQNIHSPCLPGFRPLCRKPRPYDLEHGGVAVYARKHLHQYLSLIEDMPHLGMAWVRFRNPLGGRDTFIGALYLPHHTSTYYTRENRSLNFQTHIAEITRCVELYSASGNILLAGDLNARMGSLDDRPDWELGEWCPEGALLECPEARIARLAPQRSTLDLTSASNPNPQGKHLIHLIRSLNLLILNGRTPGDMEGHFTFHASGQDRASLIDYFLATPSLTRDSSGAPIPGTSLRVTHPDLLPLRPGGGSFDHALLTLTLPLSCSPAAAPDAGNGQTTPCEKFVWRDEHKEAYTSALLNHPALDTLPSEQSEPLDSLITTIITQTVDRLASKGIHLKPKPPRPPSSTKPCNPWFKGKCEEARSAYRSAVRDFGQADHRTLSKYKEYKITTRRVKRAWEAERARTRMDELVRDPKRFWAAYRGLDSKPNQFSIRSWTQYFTQLFTPPPPSPNPCPPRTFPPPTPEHTAAARPLNDKFTLEETLEALRHAKLGKSPGLNGIALEFIKHACSSDQPAFAELITQCFNNILETGLYPDDWGVAALAPVPKPKGNPDKQDDYRGIAVGQSISKLFSLTLLRRLDRWAEKQGHRARGQAGFRSGRGTGDNAFILSHLIDKYTHQKKPIYVAFIDFRKAYDSVDRSVLWEALVSLGLHGPALNALKAMYQNVRMAVRQGGEAGTFFEALLGVKQGDPLSPLLFGLLIDRFESYLTTLLPSIGAEILHSRLNLLLFADDLCLIAESPEELQTLLNALHTFCLANKLTVNPTKSEVVAFNPPSSPTPPLRFGTSTIPIKTQFVYLGILFDGAKALKNAWRRSAEKGSRASFLVARQANTMEIHTPHMRSCLFNTMALPVVAYGCETWGPYALSTKSASTQIDHTQLSFLKHSLGLPPSTTTASLKSETNFTRITSRILKRILKFHNTLLKRPDSDLARMALVENKQLARDLVPCWSLLLHQTLLRDKIDSSLSLALAPDTLNPKLALELREKRLDELLLKGASTLLQIPNLTIHTIPSDNSDGFKTLKHILWFKPDPLKPTHNFTHHLHNRRLVHTMARFRTSSHQLMCERGRSLRLQRHERFCPLCTPDSVEDEWHLITCTEYTHIRTAPEFKRLLEQWPPHPSPLTDQHIHTIMNPPPHLWQPFALLIDRCMNHRDACLKIKTAIPPLTPPL